MEGTDRILALARQLGDAVAAHERTDRLKQAKAAFEADDEAQKLQKEYDEAVTTLRAKLAGGQPLEPEEKRKEAELRDRVAGSETIAAFLRAQADFHELLQSVNETVQDAVGI